MEKKRSPQSDSAVGDTQADINSKSFLLKLGCMTRQGDPPLFRGQRCALVVSQEYTITGFWDGGAETFSIIQVNNAHTLSLGAKELGHVLGIDFSGLPVPSVVNADALLEDEVVRPKARARAWNQTHGFLCSSFRTDFREYVEERQKRLYLPGREAGRIAAAKAYCLKEEFSHNVRYNWAQDKADHVNTAMRGCTGKGTGGELSTAVKCFLSGYIGASLSLLKRGLAGTGGPQPLRRNSRSSQESSKQSSADVNLGGQKRANLKPRARGRNGRFLPRTQQQEEALNNPSDGCIVDGEETGTEEEEEEEENVEEEDVEEEENVEEEDVEEEEEEPEDQDHSTVQAQEEEHEEDSRNDAHDRCGKQCKLNGGSVHDQLLLARTELMEARTETKDVALRGMAMAQKSLELVSKVVNHQAHIIQFYKQRAGNFRRKKMELEKEKKDFQKEKREFALELERFRRNGSTS